MRINRCELPLIFGMLFLLLLSVVSPAQNGKQSRVLVIDGQTGKAPVIEQNGHTYVDLEALTQITHGSLSFKADRIVLSLPTANAKPASRSRKPGSAKTFPGRPIRIIAGFHAGRD